MFYIYNFPTYFPRKRGITMDKNYELFIKQLINGIHGTIGIPMENMGFARKGENFAEMGRNDI